MRIGTLAARTGVTVQTLRFYERRNLIEAPLRTQAGQRDYPPNAVDDVREIRQCQDLGFTLGEIRTLRQMRDKEHGPADTPCALVADKVRELDETIERLQRMRDELERRRVECGCTAAYPAKPRPSRGARQPIGQKPLYMLARR